jgi:hypothetical protein
MFMWIALGGLRRSPVHEDDFEERVIKPMRASYRERFGIELYSSQFKVWAVNGRNMTYPS